MTSSHHPTPLPAADPALHRGGKQEDTMERLTAVKAKKAHRTDRHAAKAAIKKGGEE